MQSCQDNPKNFYTEKSTNLRDTHAVQYARLMRQKTDVSFIGKMFQKLLVNGFKWVKNLSKYNEIFIKDYNENSDIGYFLEVDIDCPEKLFNLKIYHFYPKGKK